MLEAGMMLAEGQPIDAWLSEAVKVSLQANAGGVRACARAVASAVYEV